MRPDTFILRTSRSFLVTLLLIFFIAKPAIGNITVYGKLESELVYDNLLTSGQEQEDLLINKISFNPKFKFFTGNTIGFLDICGRYETEDSKVMSESDNSSEFIVNKAYLEYQNSGFSVLIGKDRLLKGVGYGWNPSDITNPQKSPLYRDESKRGDEEGVGMACVSYYGFKDLLFYELAGGVIPTRNLDEAKKFLYTKFNYGSFEGFLIGGFQEKQQNIYGGYIRTTVPYLPLLTFYGEFQTVEFRDNNKYLLGLQYNPVISCLPGNLQLQIESFYNQDGCNNMDDYFAKNPNIAPILGESLRHYYYIGCMYNNILSRFSIGVMKNTDEDKSGVVSFLYSRFIAKEASLNIGGYYCIFSDSEKEFARLTNMKSELYAGLSIYFN